MNIYAIGDLHLSFDENIDKPMDAFGAGWEDHAERLRENWDETITAEDVVLIPGDISWALRPDEALADLAWIHERPGRKIFVKGNHDLWWVTISKLNAMYEDMHFIQNDAVYIEELDIAVAGSRGWALPGSDEYGEHDEKIYRRELIRLENSLAAAAKYTAGSIIAMMHFPPADDKSRSSGYVDLLEKYGVKTCIYGHLHGQQAYAKGIKGEHGGVKYMLVSLDYLAAKPKLIV